LSKPEPIEKQKLLLVEGKDAFHFFCHACRFYRDLEDVQVMDFRSISELTNFLLDLTIMDGFDEVDTIVVVRDAEQDAEAAKESIQDSMAKAKIPVPEKSFKFTTNDIVKTAFMVLPGPKQKDGTLEDLCLLTVEDDPLLECVNDYLECVKAKGEKLPRIHKNKLHCFIAGRDESVGKPIGLAFKARIWHPDHSALIPFKRIIQEM
jgi:hypothetical protein